ncbi:MAG: UDP-N-acetylenolpyruvoylglucosamine reductase [Candidatus Kerfeldbacteria bacterium CG08_land_8_20_14_0_20_42_7]|uniref:UDP-N-acetylenolpyruvoylglucosamine reductase n=1 Tax=Candidatus Kerfeldbacteria bacterium CG08_land_8_20_14_0_20_42_7 TaxID=2014245 RepID=A0A2H0YST8_9BACT|nr:MAG: UDP-N-acetylenolpyruvoylglucosamine reductase [Candidatus Kerfeldbacteria bacterium CG08_land_8_20_14_0_20_42_7]
MNIRTFLQNLNKTTISYEANATLANLTTFKIGGLADVIVYPTTAAQLLELAKMRLLYNVPYIIIGGGSNILISDEGFRGLVIAPRLQSLTVQNNTLKSGASVGLQQLIQFAAKNGLSGLEHLVGIPGSVGGALAGNAGTAHKWINASVSSLTAINFKTATEQQFTEKECQYGYRTSIFKNSDLRIIAEGTFVLQPKPILEIHSLMKEYLSKRNKQPSGNACAGCIFKNPEEITAGRLIDELGLKGKKIGQAQISQDHGNFFVNLGNARATDIIKLISYVKQQARDKRRIQLQEEIRYIGF